MGNSTVVVDDDDDDDDDDDPSTLLFRCRMSLNSPNPRSSTLVTLNSVHSAATHLARTGSLIVEL